jgi:hypothetical protein
MSKNLSNFEKSDKFTENHKYQRESTVLIWASSGHIWFPKLTCEVLSTNFETIYTKIRQQFSSTFWLRLTSTARLQLCLWQCLQPGQPCLPTAASLAMPPGSPTYSEVSGSALLQPARLQPGAADAAPQANAAPEGELLPLAPAPPATPDYVGRLQFFFFF